MTDFGVPTNSVTNPSLETLLYFNQSPKRKKEEEAAENRWSNLKLYALVRMCYVGHSGTHNATHTHTHRVGGNKGPKAAGKNCSVI